MLNRKLQGIKNNLIEVIKRDKTIVLFTGDKTSTLLMSIIKGMEVSAFFVDTGFHFNEIMDYVRTEFSEVRVIQNPNPSADPEDDIQECCSQRKSSVLKEYLASVDAETLIVPFMDRDRENGIEWAYIKGIDDIEILRPMAGLTEGNVWQRIKDAGLPFSRIYNRGYSVVDCKYCTTRYGRKKPEKELDGLVDEETKEKLKALGYM